MANKKKPLLFGQEATDTEQLHEADAYAWENFTPGWVPGYDERYKANEIARSNKPTHEKERIYKQLGVGPGELSAEVTWVRVAGPDGAHSYNAQIDLASWRARGYRPATEEDLRAHGFQLPPTAHVTADGSIRREDTALWIVDGERARRNRAQMARFNAEFHAMGPVETYDPDVPEFAVEHNETKRQITLDELKE